MNLEHSKHQHHQRIATTYRNTTGQGSKPVLSIALPLFSKQEPPFNSCQKFENDTSDPGIRNIQKRSETSYI